MSVRKNESLIYSCEGGLLAALRDSAARSLGASGINKTINERNGLKSRRQVLLPSAGVQPCTAPRRDAANSRLNPFVDPDQDSHGLLDEFCFLAS